jgi:hypothetical protein
MRAATVGLALLFAAYPAVLPAQAASEQAQSGSNGSPEARASAEESRRAAVDVDRLGISVARIRRDLDQLPPADTFDGRRLRSYIYVYGAAPPIRLFTESERPTSPAPYGGMTHSEFLNLVTPQQFRSPAANVGNVAIAISDWAKKRAEERKRREERERRAREQR